MNFLFLVIRTIFYLEANLKKQFLAKKDYYKRTF